MPDQNGQPGQPPPGVTFGDVVAHDTPIETLQKQAVPTAPPTGVTFSDPVNQDTPADQLNKPTSAPPPPRRDIVDRLASEVPMADRINKGLKEGVEAGFGLHDIDASSHPFVTALGQTWDNLKNAAKQSYARLGGKSGFTGIPGVTGDGQDALNLAAGVATPIDMLASGIDGMATLIEGGSKELIAGAKKKDPQQMARGFGKMLSGMGQAAAGAETPDVAGGIAKVVPEGASNIRQAGQSAVEGVKSVAEKAKEKVYPTIPEKPVLQPEPVLPQKPTEIEPTLPNAPEEQQFGKSEPILPEKPAPIPQTPKPVTPHVEVESPFDDATIRKLGGGDLSAEARAALREHVGETYEPGSSDELHLLKAVRPVNDTITTLGNQLNEVLEKAPEFKESPSQMVQERLGDLDRELPGGTEENLGKAITKEYERYADRLESTNPREINETIRDLDSRIKSYRAPEEPLNAPSDAADAARVTMRRALRDKLNTEIPDSAPLNAKIAPEMEARTLLRKKFKDVAFDSDAADAQYASELQKGKQQIANKTAQATQDEQYKTDVEKAKAEYAGQQDAAKKAIDLQNQTAKTKYDQDVAQIKQETTQKNQAAKDAYQKEVDRLQEAVDKANAETTEKYKTTKEHAETIRDTTKTVARGVVGAALGGLFGGPIGAAIGAVIFNGPKVLKAVQGLSKIGKSVSEEVPPVPLGHTHIRDSKGVEYTLPTKNLEAAKEHDPGLEVLRTA